MGERRLRTRHALGGCMLHARRCGAAHATCSRPGPCQHCPSAASTPPAALPHSTTSGSTQRTAGGHLVAVWALGATLALAAHKEGADAGAVARIVGLCKRGRRGGGVAVSQNWLAGWLAGLAGWLWVLCAAWQDGARGPSPPPEPPEPATQPWWLQQPLAPARTCAAQLHQQLVGLGCVKGGAVQVALHLPQGDDRGAEEPARC